MLETQYVDGNKRSSKELGRLDPDICGARAPSAVRESSRSPPSSAYWLKIAHDTDRCLLLIEIKVRTLELALV